MIRYFLAAIQDCSDLVQHLPYTSDLTPAHHNLFPKQKNGSAGTRLALDDAISAVEDFFTTAKKRTSIVKN